MNTLALPLYPVLLMLPFSAAQCGSKVECYTRAKENRNDTTTISLHNGKILEREKGDKRETVRLEERATYFGY